MRACSNHAGGTFQFCGAETRDPRDFAPGRAAFCRKCPINNALPGAKSDKVRIVRENIVAISIRHERSAAVTYAKYSA